MLLAEPGVPSTASELLRRLQTRYPFDGLELSIQTTRDDLRLLVECGFPVVPLNANGDEVDLDNFDSLTGRLKNTRWTLRDPARIGELHCEGLPRPSAADVLALDLLRSALSQCAPAGFWLAPTVRRLLDEVAKIQSARTVTARQGRLLVQARLRASETVIAASVFPSPCKIQNAATGDWVRVEFEASSIQEAERLVLSLGELVVVEEPLILRDSVRERLKAACRIYTEGTKPSTHLQENP